MNDAQLKELDAAIAHLKFAYEQYFMGLERQAPLDEHADVTRRVRAASTTQINNTALRFQRNNIVAKYNTYQAYWERIMRQIEEGTYKRDRLRAAKITQAAKEKAAAQAQNQAAGAAQAAPTGAAAKAAAPVAAAAPAAAQTSPYQGVYDQYTKALASVGSAANITPAALAASLSKQAEAIKTKYGCRGVDFKVTVENGKAQIKAVLIK